MQLQQVLNLVRSEAERQAEIGGRFRHVQVSEKLARTIIVQVAGLLNIAATCPVEKLQELSDFAAKCQSSRYLQRHCGSCEEHDKSHECPACGEVKP